MIERIEVIPETTKGKHRVRLVGLLARILEETVAPKQNAVRFSDGGRVLLVAGTGFEPVTFRL